MKPNTLDSKTNLNDDIAAANLQRAKRRRRRLVLVGRGDEQDKGEAQRIHDGRLAVARPMCDQILQDQDLNLGALPEECELRSARDAAYEEIEWKQVK
jgi:hypothetical protein